MRFWFALLAVVGLLASPVSSAVAMRHCTQMGAEAQANAAMSARVQMAMPVFNSDRCCDQKGKTFKHKRSCAQACLAACGVDAVLIQHFVGTSPPSKMVVMAPARADPYESHPPRGPKRPPRSIA